MTEIHFDFSPKNGPRDLIGKWSDAASSEAPLSIAWPDGNTWRKAGTKGRPGPEMRPATHPFSAMRLLRVGALSLFGLLAVAAAVFAYLRQFRPSKPAPI